MPILDIFGHRETLGDARDEILFLRQFVADELSVEEWPMDESHISLRIHEIEGALIGEVELVITAHFFADRIKSKDRICFNIREKLENRWNKQVRVWLKLVELGYGVKNEE